MATPRKSKHAPRGGESVKKRIQVRFNRINQFEAYSEMFEVVANHPLYKITETDDFYMHLVTQTVLLIQKNGYRKPLPFEDFEVSYEPMASKQLSIRFYGDDLKEAQAKKDLFDEKLTQLQKLIKNWKKNEELISCDLLYICIYEFFCTIPEEDYEMTPTLRLILT